MYRFPNRTLLIIAAFALFLVPAAAIAAVEFEDVPEDNVFKADIEWLADAEVTKGCNPPANTRFCPGSNVTREQMAAFMHRLATNQVVEASTAIEADNADKLDGMDSGAFASVAHDHDGAYLAVAGTAVDSDKLDGMDSGAFASVAHDHDGAYLAVAGTAVDSDKLDGKDSAAFMEHGDIVMSTSGSNWVNHGAGAVSLAAYGAYSYFGGAGYVELGLDAPTVIGAVEYRIKSVEVCYELDAGAFVDQTVVYGSDGASATFLEQELTDHTGTGCHVIAVDPLVATPNGAAVRVGIGDGGGGGVTGNLFGVRATWTPAP